MLNVAYYIYKLQVATMRRTDHSEIIQQTGAQAQSAYEILRLLSFYLSVIVIAS